MFQVVTKKLNSLRTQNRRMRFISTHACLKKLQPCVSTINILLDDLLLLFVTFLFLNPPLNDQFFRGGHMKPRKRSQYMGQKSVGQKSVFEEKLVAGADLFRGGWRVIHNRYR